MQTPACAAIHCRPVTARSLLDRLRGFRGSAAAITVPMLLAMGVFVALAASDGGFFPATWLPAALLAALLLAIALLTISTRAAVPRLVLAAVSLMTAYTAWSYLSIIWAGDPGLALEGANRTLLYTAVLALFAVWPMRGTAATVVLGAFGLGVAVLGLVTALGLMATADPSPSFTAGRLLDPVGYVNGNVALWFSAVLPCVFLAARREVWPPVRALALGGAGLLVGLALLTQSRGWLYTLPLVLLLFFLVAPGRVRNAVAALAVAAGVVLVSLEPVLEVLPSAEGGQPAPALVDAAVRALLISAGALAAGGLLVALFDRGVTLPDRSARRTRLATGLALSVAAVAGVAVALGSVDDPLGRAADALAEFRTGGEAGGSPAGSTRFASPAAGQNRFDFWSVAFAEFQERPVLGIGADNFEDAYAQAGESAETPRYPHSLELRVLSQTGIVGSILFLGAIAAAVAAGVLATLRASRLGAAAAGTALASFLYWAVHGSVDWFFELPALGAPAFALLGLAASLAPRDEHPTRGRAPAPIAGGRVRPALVALGALVAIVLLGAPWLAQRQIDRAIAVWPVDPDAAFTRLDSAAALNPVSSEPHTTAAAIALRLDRPGRATAAFEAALEHDPVSAYSVLQLGALASEDGRPAEARAFVARAAELAPQDGEIVRAQSQLRRGEQLDASAIYDRQLDRRGALVGE